MEKLINCIGVKAGTDVSDSGIFLDQNSELNLDMISAKQDDSEGGLYSLMNEAKKQAFTFLKEAVLAGLTTHNRQALNKYIGFVGSPQFKGTLEQEEGELVQLEIRTKELVSVYMKVKRIGLVLDTEATVEVRIPALNRSFEVVAAANTPSFLNIPIEQPLLVPLDGNPILIEYTVGEFNAKANVVNCNCASKDNYLAGYFEKGFVNQPAHGIIMEAELFCLSSELIGLNYENDEGVAAALARSVYYKALELLVEKIIGSGDVNRYTMLDTNHLYGKRNHFKKEFNDRINWLVSGDGIDVSLNSCFACGSKATGTRKSGILI